MLKKITEKRLNMWCEGKDEEGNPGYEFVAIDNRKAGEYSIEVVPESDANLTDTYTLRVATDYTTTVLAENVAVSEIPVAPYVFESTFYFDTGSSNKPYPSISGTHNGTITPSQPIPVQNIYTYPCPGTGGHTEHARIWNSTLNVTATWDGYTEDWHNITFDDPFTLVAGETYNYTIRTGSYPQVHHIPALLTTNGWINSTKFVDVNGKIYYDWIPAIRLS